MNAEKLQQNWDKLIGIINDTFEGERKENLLKFYGDFQERMMFAPASAKEHYHNAFPGGYVEHVLHIIECAKRVHTQWAEMGAHINYTKEELIFSAMHHDLGKVGDLEHDYYIPQKSEWHRLNRGELYTHNPKLQYMSVPDRGLWLLQHYGIKVTDKEMIGMRLTDGLYDEANKKYFMSYNPDWELRSILPHVLHQADMMASRIEYQNWKFRGNENENQSQSLSSPKKNTTKKRTSLKAQEPSKNMDAFKELFGEKANG